MDPSHTGCIKGTIHEGLPQGEEEMIHDLNTYVVGNRKDPKAIIVMYSDIFSLLLPNNKLIADSFAKSGEYLVYFPDFFKGDAVKLNVADLLIPVDAAKQSSFKKYTGILANAPSFIMWMTRHKEGPTTTICMEFLEKLRRATPTTQKIGMVGFCWGGKYALSAGLEKHMIDIEGKKTPLVDAIVALHPSNLILPADVETLVVPTTCGWGVDDEVVSFKTKAQVEEIHANAEKAGKKLPEIEHKVYKPGRHGFAVRGNPDDPEEKACLVDSEAQVLNWFQRWL